jgi:DNA-binding beta-propeller fold protein YncE
MSSCSTFTFTDVFDYRPRICPMAIWNSSATTIFQNNSIDALTWSLFVDRLDTLHVHIPHMKQVRRWGTSPWDLQTSINTTRLNGTSIFVAYNGDLYVDGFNGSSSTHQIVQESINTTAWNAVMHPDGPCHGLFVSIYNDIYCSISHLHIVQRRRSIGKIYSKETVAGNGTAGAADNQLNNSRGIYVTCDLDLYVADCDNNRVQLFRFNHTFATDSFTSSGTLVLSCPTSVVLDANQSLFVVDSGNHRILRHHRGSFQCIVGCTGQPGARTDQLNQPSTLALDSRGNLYVLDRGNRRVQQFALLNTSCGKSILQMDVGCVLPRSVSVSVPKPSFVVTPLACGTVDTIGLRCDVGNAPCTVLQPCQSNSTCQETNTATSRYECMCSTGWAGALCETDIRVCQWMTCWNGGEYEQGYCDDESKDKLHIV